MSTKTEILKLTKPAATDIVDISVINENMDIIDENIVAKVELDKIKKNLDDSDAALKSGYESADESIRTDLHTTTESLKSGYESADESIRTDLRTTTESLKSGYESADESIRTDLHTTTERIENLEVGGRNLLTSTSDSPIEIVSSSSSDVEIFDGLTSMEVLENTYVLSFWAKASADGEIVKAYFYNPNTTTKAESSQGKTSPSGDGFISFDLSTSWNKYYVKYTQNNQLTKKHILIRSAPSNNNATISVKKIKLEYGSTPSDWTPAPEDIKNEIATVNTKVENKLSNCDLILDTSFSTSGTINIPISKTYSFYTIILKGDDNNGITFTIPKYVMDNYYSTFYLDVTDFINTGYSAKANGRVYNNAIEVRSVSLVGWSKVSVNVFGVY